MPAISQHVVPRNGRWAIRTTGAKRAYRKFDTMQEAIEVARKIARKKRRALYIFGADGRIRNREEPLPPGNKANGGPS